MTLGLFLPHILHNSAETAAAMPPTPPGKKTCVGITPSICSLISDAKTV